MKLLDFLYGEWGVPSLTYGVLCVYRSRPRSRNEAWQEEAYCPWRIKSAIRSPSIIVVTLVLARIQLGIMEASTTRRLCRPCTLPYWSTTAMGSDAGPILQVPEIC